MRKCKICKSSEHMAKKLDTRWNECFECKPNLDLDDGELNYLIEEKFIDHDFIVNTVEGNNNELL